MQQQRQRIGNTIGELAVGLAMTALGAVWALTSIGYGVVGDGGRLAPGTVPFAAGGLLAVCGVALLVRAVLVHRTGEPTSAEASPDEDLADAPVVEAVAEHDVTEAPTTPLGRLAHLARKNSVLSVFVIVLIGVLLMPLLGFSPAFALTIFAILLLIERQSVLKAALVAAATALFGFLLFEVVFNLPLPEPFFL